MIAPPPADVWLHAYAERLPGTMQLAGWLGRTILTLVTRYTQPGDRVLLLTPPERTPFAPAIGAHSRRPDPYIGLTEALWTVTRLGRGADTALADNVRNIDVGQERRARSSESASGPGPDQLAGPLTGRAHPVPSCVNKRHPSGTYDLIISVAHPQSTNWLRAIGWDEILTPSGLVAVVTHGDVVAGRFLDPVPDLLNALRNHRRVWREHIAVLTHPVGSERRPRRAQPETLETAHCGESGPAYHDLIVVGPRSTEPLIADAPARAEMSDD